jgi:hypothetical protein
VDSADRPGVGALGHRPDLSAGPADLEGDVNDVRSNVITQEEQPADLDLDAGLLAHFPGQCLGQGLAGLQLAAGQRPAPRAVGVLIEQQDLLVLDFTDRREPGISL